MVFGASLLYCRNYISKLPPFAFQKDWLHMKPLGIVSLLTLQSHGVYAAQPCGKNKLRGMAKSMFTEIGVPGKTNDSL